MSLWRREALTRFPELHREIADADGLAYLWSRLFDRLEAAYGKAGPRDEKSIAVIYDYAHWCLTHRSIEVRTAVVICFYEDLLDNPEVSRDLPGHLTQTDFDMLGSAWEYGTKRDFAELQKEFVENKAQIDSEKQKRRPAAKAERY